jgi:hypothetical protein
MKIRPGRPRGFIRLARALGLDRNPLRRATDRAEAWIRVGLLGIFLIAGPMAALGAGHWAYHAGITAARVSAAPPQHVKPADVRQAPATTDLSVGQGGRAWAGARGENTAPSGRTDEVLTAVMTLAALGLVLLVVLRLALTLLSRRRLAAWEMAWSKVGPQWSKRRP